MRGESDAGDIVDLGEKQLGRGWFVGSDQCRDKLSGMIGGRSDNLRGEQRRAHDEKEAERLVRLALAELKISEEELLEMKSAAAEKQVIAWLLKRHTTVTGVWLGERLNMGHRSNVSRAIAAFDRVKDVERRIILEKMMQCTG